MLPTGPPPPFRPKIVVIRRRSNQGFGFTLRHFIAYPPETCSELTDTYQRKAMETIFIKEVQPNGPAAAAGLQMGDRVLMVNNISVAGISYSAIVTMIKQTPSVLRLQVVPKECDVLQMYYTDIAHIPESNRQMDTTTSKSLMAHNMPIMKKNLRQELGASHCVSKHSPIRHEEVTNNDGLLVRAKPVELSVLSHPPCESEFMVRIRKSIEQKEEFLKSSSSCSSYNSPTTSMFPMPKNNFKQTSKLAATNDLNLCGRNAASFPFSNDRIQSIAERDPPLSFPSKSSSSCSNSGSNNFQKELLFLESFPETGVTNKVFDRKQAHLKEIEHLFPLTTMQNQCEINEKSTYKNEVSKKIMEYNQHVASINKNQLVENVNSKQSLPVVKISNVEEMGAGSQDCSTSKLLSQQIIQKSTDVVRRYKSIVFDDNKPMRRISYLKATNNECEFHSESSNELNAVKEKQSELNIERHSANIEVLPEVINGKEDEIEIYKAEFEVKSPCIYGKRSSDFRSWRPAKIELKGDNLKIYTMRNTKADTNVIEINIKNFNVIEDIKEEKRKYVFRLNIKMQLGETGDASDCSSDKNCEYKEIAFKTKTLDELKRWISLLQEKARDIDLQQMNSQRQLAEPQKTAAISSVPTNTYCDENIQDYTTITTTSPSGCSATTKSEIESDSASFQSPIMKSRKAQKSMSDKDLGSPKTKNWKDLLFRRIHGTNSEISNSLTPARPIGSIGVPLKSCPMSKDNEFLPHIVDVCTKIVETKGLNVIGIYRIPGNKAAISDLKEQVNKPDFSWDKIDTDVRWEDVNVVSSLLKLFIRSLPDALLPSTFYNNFIEADKKTDEKRLKELKHLLKSLPIYSYETMKHIIRHLHRVSKNCELNLMEPKNLAIIFGPSIIRTPNDTLEIAVKDMKHQCRIVELLVSQYEYFFENGTFPDLEHSSSTMSCTSQSDQTSILLDNVSKIEHRLHDKESMASRFIPTLRRRTHSKRSAVSSETYSGESVLSLDYKKSPEPVVKETLEHKKSERNSLEISILLTDEDSSNSRISDSGSMSLTTITDTLDTKLRNLRSGSESADENDSPNNQQSQQQQQQQQGISRRNFPQTLALHENIPYADESPERHSMPDSGGGGGVGGGTHLKPKNGGCNLNIVGNGGGGSNCIRDIVKTNLNNSKFSPSVYESCSDDSEVSTTSDPKESLLISPFFLERYKKRRDYRLFRSASFNCRNYSTRQNSSNLTKDEKTDMNITKKRQIQNKQNRSIKRRHTVGGPHDYSTTITRRTNNNNNDHVLEVGIRIKNVNVNRRS